MNKQTTLTQKLSNHFPMHPSRRKTFLGLIFGALTSNQVTHKSLSRHVVSDNELSATRKVKRFFQYQELELSNYVETVISIFDLKFQQCFLIRANYDTSSYLIEDPQNP